MRFSPTRNGPDVLAFAILSVCQRRGFACINDPKRSLPKSPHALFSRMQLARQLLARSRGDLKSVGSALPLCWQRSRLEHGATAWVMVENQPKSRTGTGMATDPPRTIFDRCYVAALARTQSFDCHHASWR
jgi:hypothetical protein